MFRNTVYAMLAIFVVALTAAGCQRATHITPQADTIRCDRPQTTDSLLVSSDGKWEVAYRPQWMQVSQPNDTTLRYQLSENRTRRTRQDSLVLRSGSLQCAICVIQGGVAKYVEVDDKPLVFRPEGEDRDIRIGTDGCFIHVSCPDFITYYHHKGVIHLSVGQNRTGDRQGNIIITVDSLQRTIPYSQEMLPHLKAYQKVMAATRAEAAVLDQTETVSNPQPQSAPSPTKKAGNCRKCGGSGAIDDPYTGMALACDMCGGKGHY